MAPRFAIFGSVKVTAETGTAGLEALAGDGQPPYFNCVPTLTG